jgi:hypothetical protein
VLTASNIGISVHRTHTANSMDAAPAAAPVTEEFKMNTVVHEQQPVVLDPRYGGQQMA